MNDGTERVPVRSLEAFGRWLDALDTARAQSETGIAALRGAGLDIPDDIRNYPKSAWEKLAETGNVAETAGEYVDRTDEAGWPIPNVCFKIPTGGGKTLLAAAALERLNQSNRLNALDSRRQRSIYQQTKAALWNQGASLPADAGARERPDGSRCWKKTTPLQPSDVAKVISASCSLMLCQSANQP